MGVVPQHMGKDSTGGPLRVAKGPADARQIQSIEAGPGSQEQVRISKAQGRAQRDVSTSQARE